MTPTRSNREHSFDWELAVIVGLEKAILLKNISYWCEENRRRAIETYFLHGTWWTSESIRSLVFKYPYFTKTSISRWMNELNAARWVLSFGQTGGQNFYAPGPSFDAWNAGGDWKSIQDGVLSQNGTPAELSQNGTPPSQNGTVGVPKWDTGCPKMGHTNVEMLKINVELNARTRAPKKPRPASDVASPPHRRHRDTPMPSSGPAPRPTTFAASIWATETPEAWRVALATETNISDLDAAWYFHRCKDWSAEKGSTSANWVVTAAKFARDDQRKQKLVTLQPLVHDRHSAIPNPSSSRPGKPGFTLHTSRQDVLDVAERVLAKRSARHGSRVADV